MSTCALGWSISAVRLASLTLIYCVYQVADPDGYFKSGSRAAEAAKAKAQKAMQLEKQQRELKEQRRKEKLVSPHAWAGSEIGSIAHSVVGLSVVQGANKNGKAGNVLDERARVVVGNVHCLLNEACIRI